MAVLIARWQAEREAYLWLAERCLSGDLAATLRALALLCDREIDAALQGLTSSR